jgi:hypothetical protein
MQTKKTLHHDPLYSINITLGPTARKQYLFLKIPSEDSFKKNEDP